MFVKIISIIDHHQKEVVKKILKHCDLWVDSLPPPLLPLVSQLASAKREFEEEVVLDEDFFDMIA